MKAEVSITKIWDDPKFAEHFFRKQAYRHFEELVQAVGGNNSPFAFNVLENAIESAYNSDLDAFEEDCYNMSADEVLDVLGYN